MGLELSTIECYLHKLHRLFEGNYNEFMSKKVKMLIYSKFWEKENYWLLNKLTNTAYPVSYRSNIPAL